MNSTLFSVKGEETAPEMPRSCEGQKDCTTHSRVFTEHPQPTCEQEGGGDGVGTSGDQWGREGDCHSVRTSEGDLPENREEAEVAQVKVLGELAW